MPYDSPSSNDSSSSSDEDFIIDVLEVLPRPRYFRNRSNPFSEYDNTDFKQRFRLSKMMFIELLNMIQDHLHHNSHRNMSLSPMLQLLIALRYYATGAFQAVLEDHTCVHKSTVCRINPKLLFFWLLNFNAANFCIISSMSNLFDISFAIERVFRPTKRI
ncbi:putative nuclease HARBI1 [Aphis craccivora]|uniref:Putative nuclease HARBI1 n=1 Tax=Aphis craccivora TaxID=307492 RepID=A0A6G0Z8V4_APHCR|nr:putative nuclease HARBI1 [Aphis craccivora]